MLAVSGHPLAQTASSAQETTANAGTATGAQAGQQDPGKEQPLQGAISGGPIHIVPYGLPAPPPKSQAKSIGNSSNNGVVQYWGGPVISNVNLVEVLWGNFVDGPSTTGLDQFFTDITSSSYFALLAEYGTVGLNGFGAGSPPGTNQTIGPGVFGGKFTISPSLCPGSAAVPPVSCSISNAQIQTELVSQVNSGHLPQPIRDSQGLFETVYMIYFPPGVTINLSSTVSSCVRGGFCAYHSNVTASLQPQLPYGVFPDFSPASACGPARGCGNGTSFENLTSASSHELGEAVTDVDAGSINSFAPPLAWADQLSHLEIGDFCAPDKTQITVNSNTYTVQDLWSNMQNGCVSAAGHFLITAPASVIPGRPFNVTVTAEPSFSGSPLFNYSDTVHFTTSDGSGPILPADYTFVPGTDQGTHTFSATLNSLGPQTITATDTLVTAMVSNATVDVEHNPDLTISMSHAGSFKQGDTGDTYNITVSNAGDLATNGSTVTVTDSLPFNLTATAIAGSGWSCTLGPLTCTRSDALPAGAAYPSITLTVNVSNSASTPLVNNVQVSGGGELNTTNDNATDPTVVIQMPDLSIFKGHVGSFSQGQVGEIYTINVSNSGFGPTDGSLVTVTDTLPAGMTATAISGTGWSCTLSSLTCTRSDVLATFAVYPPIKLTVNVDANAGGNPPSQLTNTATVSGGGEINAANDTANDATTITPPAADLVIASTHIGDFTQGQLGAAYSLTVTNIGPAATAGSVTVNDSLSFGLTATAIGGAGWTCSTTPALNCTRSDVLPAAPGPNNSYPPITVTVNVDPGAGPVATNSSNVSGGGEFNTANDLSSDSTVVIQLPNLKIGQQHGVLAQGLAGTTYSLNVNNFSTATTTGTVTVTDTLPAGLMATDISGPGWSCTLATLTCTRSDSVGSFSNYPSIILTVNVANNAPASVTNTATVSGGGEIITSDDTSSDTSQVTPPLSMSAFNGNVNVKAGNPAVFGLSLNAPVPGTISLNCTGLPAGTACIFTPSLIVAPINTSITLTITTTAPSASAAPLPWREAAPLYAVLLPLLAAAGVINRRHKGRQKSLPLLMCLTCLATVVLLAGCGGGGNAQPPRVATPPGTYTVTVTANNSTINFQATSTVTLTVQ